MTECITGKLAAIRAAYIVALHEFRQKLRRLTVPTYTAIAGVSAEP